jgi:hypothetical protein
VTSERIACKPVDDSQYTDCKGEIGRQACEIGRLGDFMDCPNRSSSSPYLAMNLTPWAAESSSKRKNITFARSTGSKNLVTFLNKTARLPCLKVSGWSRDPVEAPSCSVGETLNPMDEATRSETRPDVPRFCPRCQVVGPADAILCVECGETLRGQGYCPICERFWKLKPGLDCPKHEVALLNEAPPQLVLSPEERSSLVTVATFSHPNQASAPRIRLEAEGIPTFLDGERIAGTTHYQVATGGVRLLVPSSLASAARIMIHQNWSTPPEADDLEDAWEDLAPEPGIRRRAIMKLAILVFLFGPVVVGLISFLTRLIGQ